MKSIFLMMFVLLIALNAFAVTSADLKACNANTETLFPEDTDQETKYRMTDRYIFEGNNLYTIHLAPKFRSLPAATFPSQRGQCFSLLYSQDREQLNSLLGLEKKDCAKTTSFSKIDSPTKLNEAAAHIFRDYKSFIRDNELGDFEFERGITKLNSDQLRKLRAIEQKFKACESIAGLAGEALRLRKEVRHKLDQLLHTARGKASKGKQSKGAE